MPENQNPEPQMIAAFAALLGAQPSPVQTIFQYCLAMVMVEGGKAQLIKTEPSEAGMLCTFETVAGDVFTLVKPTLSTAQETEMMALVREIVEDTEL